MMRQVVFMLMALMLVTGMATAQEKKAVIAVDNAVHDFGKFKEADGNVTHTFNNQPGRCPVGDNTGYCFVRLHHSGLD